MHSKAASLPDDELADFSTNRRALLLSVMALAVGAAGALVAHPDEPLHAALVKMQNRDVGRLPVVERHDRTKVVGYLGRAAILSARMKLHEEENIRQKGWASQHPPLKQKLT